MPGGACSVLQEASHSIGLSSRYGPQLQGASLKGADCPLGGVAMATHIPASAQVLGLAVLTSVSKASSTRGICRIHFVPNLLTMINSIAGDETGAAMRPDGGCGTEAGRSPAHQPHCSHPPLPGHQDKAFQRQPQPSASHDPGPSHEPQQGFCNCPSAPPFGAA